MNKLYGRLLCLCLALCCVFSLAACGGQAKLISISVTEMPAKTYYHAGDFFDKSGMKVVANYSDGTEKEIFDYSVNKTTLAIDDKAVVVNYLEKTATVNIAVVKSDREAPTEINYTIEGAALIIDVKDGVEYNFDNRGWSVATRYDGLTKGKSYSLSARYYATTVANASAINTVTITLDKSSAVSDENYNYFRNKYFALSNAENINLTSATYAQIFNMLETQGKYLIYFGGAWDDKTRQNIKDLNDVAVEYGVLVYNLDTRLAGEAYDSPVYDLNQPNAAVLRDKLLAKLNNQEISECSFVKNAAAEPLTSIPEATLLAVEVDGGNVTVLATGNDKQTFSVAINSYLL